MAISTNRTCHRETDLLDWGPTLKQKVSTFFKHPHHLLPGIQLEAIRNSFKTNCEMETDLTFFLA